MLAVDPGSKRVGLAVSDPTGTIAQALATVPAEPRETLAERLVGIAHQQDAKEIVVGLPRRMDGSFGPEAKAARELGFRAARDTRAAFEDFIQQRRVLRYAPDRRAYQYEKELEDFIHSRQVASSNGEGEVDGALLESVGEATAPQRRPRPRRGPPRSRS